MKRSLLIALFFVLITVNVPSQVAQVEKPVEPPADFVGDGCTMFPDGDWADCCLAHDKAYFRGGTQTERKVADGQLFRCVRAKGGFKHRVISDIMWLGVRVGGGLFTDRSFSWGFGQPKKKS